MSLQSRLASFITDIGADMKKAMCLEKTMTMQGPVTVRTGVVRLPIPEGTWSFVRAYAQVSSAPTGSNILLDIKKNGTTVHSGGTGRCSIAAGATQGQTTNFSTSTVTANDYLTVDVVQKGSTLSGDDLVFTIVLRRTA